MILNSACSLSVLGVSTLLPSAVFSSCGMHNQLRRAHTRPRRFFFFGQPIVLAVHLPLAIARSNAGSTAARGLTRIVREPDRDAISRAGVDYVDLDMRHLLRNNEGKGEKKPITRALWRVASKCAEVEKTTGADENGKPTTLWMFDASDREAKKTQ